MVPIVELLIPKSIFHITKKNNKIFIRNGKLINPKYLTIHSTGNLNSTARQERNWLLNKSNCSGASWNICVDDKEAIIVIPLNEKSNHSGNNTGNLTSIGLEICESGDREKTLKNAIKVSAFILRKFNLTYKDLRQHYDWNKKNCPRILRQGNLWQWFINEVKKEMEINAMLERLIDKYTEPIVEKALEVLIKSVNDDGIESEWATKEFNEAKKLGITDGSKPEMFATRQEVAIIVKRAIKSTTQTHENRL